MQYTKDMEVVTELGLSLPLCNDHAVSVSLPKWEDVVGYEEGKVETVSRMRCGYPRFRFPDNTSRNPPQDQSRLLNDVSLYCIYLWPSKSVALRFQDFMAKGKESCVVEVHKVLLSNQDIYTTCCPLQFSSKAKKYWQHSGEIISSRLARDIIHHLNEYISIQFKTIESVNSTLVEIVCDNLSLSEFLECSISKTENYRMMLSEGIQHTNKQVHIPTFDSIEHTIKSRITNILNTLERAVASPVKQEDVLLTPTGMASIFSALRLTLHTYQQRNNKTITPEMVVFGFPYLDTLKLMERVEWNLGGVHFLGHGNDNDFQTLEALLASSILATGEENCFRNKIAAIFTEFPSNPLIKCVDMPRLSALAKKYGVCLVVDDTIGSFANIDLFFTPGVEVDILCSSLTKIFNGTGNVMMGSMILNPVSDKYALLAKTLTALHTSYDFSKVYIEDMVVLEDNSRTFLHRSQVINQNTLQLALWLSSHDAIERVYYSGLHGQEQYLPLMRRGELSLNYEANDTLPEFITSVIGKQRLYTPGFGCMLSFILKPSWDTKVFYDSLEFNKGPSLGTNFTLVCPYTLLAHYLELDWAASYGVPELLIRVSVGLEYFEDIQSKFERALQTAKINSIN